jgi:oxygen-dependent protoporphyrinogen oxidase
MVPEQPGSTPSSAAPKPVRPVVGDADVVVVGAGIAGLIAARECARRGLSVIVLESTAAVGGLVAARELGGIAVDVGAESFATRGAKAGVPGPVAALIADLGLAEALVTPNQAGAWVQLAGGAAPLPALSLLGIPGAPLADDVRRVIGWGGAIRAQLDRYMPLLRVRKETDLGDIVRRRMGQKVLDRLVAPVVAGVHSAAPGVVDVHAVAPGLTNAMTTQGSLSGAVMAMLAERESTVVAGSAVAGITGGMSRLVATLATNCEYFGVEIRTGVTVTSLASEGDVEIPGASWTISTSTTANRAAADDWTGAAASTEPASAEPARAEPILGSIRSRAVVIATSFLPGIELLGGIGVATGGATDWPTPASVDIVHLLINDPRLDDAPRGTGVLVSAEASGVGAKALTHATSKWSWLAEEVGRGRHIVRLSYDRGESAESPSRATAIADASVLLGLDLDPATVADFLVTTWTGSLAFATVGHRQRVKSLLDEVTGIGNLAVVGSWVAGTGLAATVPQATRVAAALALDLQGIPHSGVDAAG